jgi:hypothetical protein
MDPPTARLSLTLQLDDVNTILTSLPSTPTNELIAFRCLRDDLTRKLQEVNSQTFAHSVMREENRNCVAFGKLVAEEVQAERTWSMCLVIDWRLTM